MRPQACYSFVRSRTRMSSNPPAESRRREPTPGTVLRSPPRSRRRSRGPTPGLAGPGAPVRCRREPTMHYCGTGSHASTGRRRHLGITPGTTDALTRSLRGTVIRQPPHRLLLRRPVDGQSFRIHPAHRPRRPESPEPAASAQPSATAMTCQTAVQVLSSDGSDLRGQSPPTTRIPQSGAGF